MQDDPKNYKLGQYLDGAPFRYSIYCKQRDTYVIDETKLSKKTREKSKK